jgi:hypothetical protein
LEREEEVLQKTLVLKHKDKSIKELLLIPRGSKIAISRENTASSEEVDLVEESPKSFRYIFFIEGNPNPYYVSDYRILGDMAIHALFSTLPLPGTAAAAAAAAIQTSEEEGEESESDYEEEEEKEEAKEEKESEEAEESNNQQMPPPPPLVSSEQSPSIEQYQTPPSTTAEPVPAEPSQSAVPESPVPNPEAPLESPVPNPKEEKAKPEQTAEPSFIASLFTPAKTENPAEKSNTGFFSGLFKTASPTEEKVVQQKSRE